MSKKKSKEKLFFSKTLDFLDHYLPEQAMKSANTIETYRDALTIFRRYLSDTLRLSIRTFCFEDCTHDLLLEFLHHLHESGNAATACNNRLAAIRAYLWYVACSDISLQSVALTASHVPFLKVPKRIREIIEEEDLAALLSAPAGTKTGKHNRMILILLYDSAVRVSELLSLDVQSVNLEAAIPYIRICGKGDKERIVALTDMTADHLKEYMKIYHPEKEDSEQIRPEHPNLPKSCYPHMIRRTKSTNMYRDGAELELISRILGHSSTETTKIYAIPSVKMMRNVMETGKLATDETPQWPDDEAELARQCGLR